MANTQAHFKSFRIHHPVLTTARMKYFNFGFAKYNQLPGMKRGPELLVYHYTSKLTSLKSKLYQLPLFRHHKRKVCCEGNQQVACF